MSIEAKITAVTVIAPEHCNHCNDTGKDPEDDWDRCQNCHGATKDKPVVRLKLEASRQGGLAGQSCLTVENPPSTDAVFLSSLIGIQIWGGSSFLYVGEKRWAKRIGYTRIELMPNEPRKFRVTDGERFFECESYFDHFLLRPEDGSKPWTTVELSLHGLRKCDNPA